MRSFPPPSGPYIIGVADIEIEDLFFRLYYPVRLSTEPQGHIATLRKGETKPYWLPSWHYARGYGNFLSIPSLISVPLFSMFFSGVQLPNAVFEGNIESSSQSNSKEKEKFPLVLFSHGLGGMRTTYSSICSEFASYGMICAAVEHRDQSASVTFQKNSQDTIHYQPLPSDVDEYEFRNSQVKHREKELLQMYELFQKINDGVVYLNEIPSKFDLLQLKGHFDFTKVCVAGHSFGGATTVEILYNHPQKFQCGIVFDGWMYPVSKQCFEEPNSNESMKPILFINSETFQWKENLERMHKKINLINNQNKKGEEIKEQEGSSLIQNHNSFMVTLLGTGHQNQSDFSLLAPSYVLRKAGMLGTADPILMIQLNHRLSISYFQRYLNFENDQVKSDPILQNQIPEIRFDESI